MNAPFYTKFPALGTEETRVITIFQDNDELPRGKYAFIENFCVDINCDCKRVLFTVLFSSLEEEEEEEMINAATITYGWGVYGKNIFREMDGFDPNVPCLDLMANQTEYAPIILEKFKQLLFTDKNYMDRVKRHYTMFKEAIIRDSHKGRINKVRKRKALGRNAPCSCGSGKKYKRCCGK